MIEINGVVLSDIEEIKAYINKEKIESYKKGFMDAKLSMTLSDNEKLRCCCPNCYQVFDYELPRKED